VERGQRGRRAALRHGAVGGEYLADLFVSIFMAGEGQSRMAG
jgi:hypothetical protein